MHEASEEGAGKERCVAHVGDARQDEADGNVKEDARDDGGFASELVYEFVSGKTHEKAHEELEHVGETSDGWGEAALVCDEAEVGGEERVVRAEDGGANRNAEGELAKYWEIGSFLIHRSYYSEPFFNSLL